MDEKANYESIDEFYSGKSVFVTGATGFLAKVIIEKLIYSCPEIQKIYILIRCKKANDVAQRMQNLLDSPVFTRIKNERPQDLGKIIPLTGDLVAPNLGLHVDDEDVLIKEVSIVFHCAATVKFNEPLKIALAVNVEGTQKILSLCHRMKKLEVFVYLSTAYSNCNHKVIEETMYPPPMELCKVYNFEELFGEDETETAKLLRDCHRPNTYTFTKALSENLVTQQLGNFRSVIIRPSIVTPSIKEPLEGWNDSWYGATGLLTAIGKGFCRVVIGRNEYTLDIIPVDYVSSLTIIAAAKSQSHKKERVLNICTSSVNPIRTKELITQYTKEFVKIGFNDLPFPGALMTDRILIAQLIDAVTMLIGYTVDFLLRIAGKEPRYVKLLKKTNKLKSLQTYFTNRSWLIKCDNSRTLYNSLDDKDRLTYPCDVKDINWKLYISMYFKGVQQYLFKNKQCSS